MLSVLLLWIKVFYWLRIFQSTAFFFKLLTQTLTDIGAFFVMLIVALATAANLFYVQNVWRKMESQNYS